MGPSWCKCHLSIGHRCMVSLYRWLCAGSTQQSGNTGRSPSSLFLPSPPPTQRYSSVEPQPDQYVHPKGQALRKGLLEAPPLGLHKEHEEDFKRNPQG